MKRCPGCQTRLEDGLLFCTSCGAKIIPEAESNVQEQPAETAKRSKGKKKWIILTSIFLAVAIAGGVLVFCLFDRPPETVWGGVYLDGDDWYVYASDMDEPLLLASRLGDYSVDTHVQNSMRISHDGKYLLYHEPRNDFEINLYCRSLVELEEEPVKLTSGQNFGCYGYFTEEEDCVYYIGKHNRLYRYDLSAGESELISDDVNIRFLSDALLLFSEDGPNLYIPRDGNLKKSTDSVNDAQLIGKYLLYTKDKKMYLYGQEEPFKGDYAVYEMQNRGKWVTRALLGSSYQVCPATGALYYQVDEELFKFADGKVTSVCDNVEDWDIAQNGDVWAIVDGTCMIYTGEETVTVQDGADEVSPIPVGGYVR